MTLPKPIASYKQRYNRLLNDVLSEPPVICPVRNLFGPGVYLRECSIPAGTTIMGAEHKTAHFCFISKGRIRVTTADGIRDFVAGDVFLSQPGDQRSGHALEDTLWTTIHANPDDCQDLNVIIPRIAHATVAQLQGGAENVHALLHSPTGELPCPSSLPALP